MAIADRIEFRRWKPIGHRCSVLPSAECEPIGDLDAELGQVRRLFRRVSAIARVCERRGAQDTFLRQERTLRLLVLALTIAIPAKSENSGNPRSSAGNDLGGIQESGGLA